MPHTTDTQKTSSQKTRGAISALVVIALFTVATSAGYEVRPGDTLAAIAAEHDTTVAALIELNGLVNADLIWIGQELSVPGADGPVLHTVARGETLAAIAKTYGTSVTDIVTTNTLANPDLLRIGLVLTIPGAEIDSAAEATARQSTTHIVMAGDTLASIARRYGTTVAAIAEANGITDTQTIYVGNQLVIGGDEAPRVLSQERSSVHTVAPGETLAHIAATFGTSVQSLADSNEIEDPNLIRIGQDLVVPGSGWSCPVSQSRYFNDWGFPRSSGRFHQGNDLFAPRGTPVVAPVSGFAELKSGVVGGLQFWLTGDDGNTYIGSHMDSFGQSGHVNAGTILGYVGDSGNALGSEPHLHFEILVNGSPVNPYPILKSSGC